MPRFDAIRVVKILTLFVHSRLAGGRHHGSATQETKPPALVPKAPGDLPRIANTWMAAMMKFTATWFRGETAISTDTVGSLAAARDIARSRLVAHRVRSGATHVEVRSEGGSLMFDSRQDMVPACVRRPTLAAQLVKRWTMPNSSPA